VRLREEILAHIALGHPRGVGRLGAPQQSEQVEEEGIELILIQGKDVRQQRLSARPDRRQRVLQHVLQAAQQVLARAPAAPHGIEAIVRSQHPARYAVLREDVIWRLRLQVRTPQHGAVPALELQPAQRPRPSVRGRVLLRRVLRAAVPALQCRHGEITSFLRERTHATRGGPLKRSSDTPVVEALLEQLFIEHPQGALRPAVDATLAFLEVFRVENPFTRQVPRLQLLRIHPVPIALEILLPLPQILALADGRGDFFNHVGLTHLDFPQIHRQRQEPLELAPRPDWNPPACAADAAAARIPRAGVARPAPRTLWKAKECPEELLGMIEAEVDVTPVSGGSA